MALSPKRNVVMVGPLPPPLHGMAAVNEAVRECLRHVQAEPLVINLAASSLSRSLKARLGRLPKVLWGLVRLATARGLSGGALYMSVSGGLGQLYEIAFACLARLRRMRLYLHHHSFAYLDAQSGLSRLLVKVAGPSTAHVSLSPAMAVRLKAMYGARRVVAVSNAVFFLKPASSIQPRRQLKTIGFISNISREKGVFEFLELMAVAQKKGVSLGAKVAGPFADQRIEDLVLRRITELPHVEYVGPKYGAEKDEFFAAIDALVFPTRYVNEAEPLTLHEAMSRAIPVVAYGRGCIPEIVGSDCGLVINPAEPFVPTALKQIEVWLDDLTAFEAASKAASARFAQAYTESTLRWQALIDEVIGRAGALDRTVDTENPNRKPSPQSPQACRHSSRTGLA